MIRIIMVIIRIRIIRRIIPMKWYPIPLLLFEGANNSNEMARHSIISIFFKEEIMPGHLHYFFACLLYQIIFSSEI